MAWGPGEKPEYKQERVTKADVAADCDSWGSDYDAEFRKFIEGIQDDDVLYKFRDTQPHSGHTGYKRFDKNGKEVARFITGNWMS